MNDTPKHTVFLLLESFELKAFHYSLQIEGRKDSYILIKDYVTSLPVGWQRDIEMKKYLFIDILAYLLQYFDIQAGETIFTIVTSDTDLYDFHFPYTVKLFTSSRKEYALVPYFSSSYLGVLHTSFILLKYYSFYLINNQSEEIYTKWTDWKEFAELISIALSHEDPQVTDMILNTLIRPVIEHPSYSLAAVAALFIYLSGINKTNTMIETQTLVLGGEVFSWMCEGIDMLFPFVVGVEKLYSLITVYADTKNIFSLTKVLKDISLSLLERASGQSLKHIGEIFTIKTKKQVKASTIIGKITIHDDDGYKTLYPVSEDIMAIEIKGIGKITYDLHYPFFVDMQDLDFKARDLLIIDTRTMERTNIINFKAWYDRIKIS